MITDLSSHSTLEVSGLPARFAVIPLKAMGEDLHKGPRRDLAKRYLETFSKNATLLYEAPLFIGRADKGKSYAAALIARIVHRRVYRAAWINCAMDLQYTDGFVSKYLPLLSRYPFVVLDDFGLVQPGSFESKQLVAIMSARYDARLPTLWTGNFDGTAEETWTQIGSMFGMAGPNMVHRLREGSEGFRLFLS